MKLTLCAVVPVYNVEKYLAECLDSIAGQSAAFDEVILVNDGSTDNSRRICEEYCKKYGYFQMVNQDNEGPSSARNTGIRLSKSEYIVFIDSDDMITDGMILKLREILCGNGYDAVFFDADILSCGAMHEPSVNYFKRGAAFCGRDMRGTDYLSEAFPRNYVVSPCGAAYKRSFIQDNQIYFEHGIYFEDNAFCLRVYLAAENLRCLPESLYIRRCREGSIMADRNTLKKCRDKIKVNSAIWDILDKSGLGIPFQIRFVSYYLIDLWRMLWGSDFYNTVTDERMDLLDKFRAMWLDRYLEEDIGLGDMLALMIYYKGCGQENLPCMVSARERAVEKMVQKLNKIPLSDTDKKIGIYGIGRNAESMLGLYKEYAGEIKGEIFFIVTENTGNRLDYMGYPLVTCDNIPKDTDRVVISSLVYMDEMAGCLKNVGVPEDKIIRLYGDDEFCDLSTTAVILAYGGGS